jgi:hypothetical protein
MYYDPKKNIKKGSNNPQLIVEQQHEHRQYSRIELEVTG